MRTALTMAEQEDDSSGPGSAHPQRDQTDESLRVERNKADSGVAEKIHALEMEADEVVRVARQRADEVMQAARDEADSDGTQSRAVEATADRERGKADGVLERERSTADALLEHERAERRRYLAAFLAVEREATDEDLVGERDHADTVVAARDEFLATVSHDLRSLLGGLALNASLLVKTAPEGTTGDKTRKHAAAIDRLVSRMDRLVGDLLDVSSIEAGKLAVLPEKVDVAKLLHDAMDAFTPIAAARDIALEGDAAGAPPHVWIDGGRMLQVLVNLISNAVKFTAPQGHVSIRIYADGGELRITVSDDGIGIPADALEAVFERFRQVSKDRRGLGLGLHISQSIVEAHGGRMWAESTLGEGSTFHVALPARMPPGA